MDINLQESYLTEIQCLSESNNNTTNLAKDVQRVELNNITHNRANSLMIGERESCKNNIDGKLETTSYQSHKHSAVKNNIPLSVGLNINNEITNENNYVHSAHSAHSTVNIEEEDDLKTTQAIMSLAQKISEQETDFKFSDGFEEEKITQDEHIVNEIQTNNSLTEPKNQHVDSHKHEDEYKMHNSLKILESLVNIEHNKLEVQLSPTENESQESNPKPNEKQCSKNIHKTALKHKKNSKSIKKTDQNLDKKKYCSKDKKQKLVKNENKSNKTENSKKNTSKKFDGQNNVQNKFSSNPRNLVELKNGENIPVIVNAACSANSETEVITTNIKDLDSTCSSEFSLAITLNDLSINEPKVHQTYENMSVKEKESCHTSTISDNFGQILLFKSSSLLSINNSDDKHDNSVKESSLRHPSPVMKTCDYKKLYEKERRSLFSPDIIFKPKSMKYSEDNKKVNQDNQLLDTELKPKITKLKTNHKHSVKEKMPDHHKPIKVKITSGRPSLQHSKKNKLKSSKSSSSKKSQSSIVNLNNHNKFKRLKVENNSDNEARIIAPEIIIKEEIKDTSDTTDISKNIEFSNVDLLQINESKENEVIENKASTDLSEDAIVERLLQKYASYNFKQLYVIIDPNMIYD